VAEVFDIITLPKARRQGIATAMMLHILSVARDNHYAIATLTASPAGQSVYQKLGFKTCCKFKLYNPGDN